MTERRVYLDANVFIYAIEGGDELASLLHRLFVLFRSAHASGITSELTLAEVLPRAIGPRRRAYLDLIVGSGVFGLQPVSRDVLIETADYRGKAGMPKLPDAIHVVTAIRSGCREILSADARLKLPEGFVVLIPDRENLSRLISELS